MYFTKPSVKVKVLKIAGQKFIKNDFVRFKHWLIDPEKRFCPFQALLDRPC